jgi:hypothetical protein
MSPVLSALVLAIAGSTEVPQATPTAAAAASDAPAKASPDIHHFGLGLDAGVPNGAALSLVGRPWYFLRLHGGVANNAASLGVHGGFSLIPFKFFVTPVMTLEGGKFFQGGGFIDKLGLDPKAGDIARHVTYAYANLHVGLELGSPRSFVFFVHAGLSRLWGTVDDLGALLTDTFNVDGVTARNATVAATLPSAKLGFYVYFL